MDNPTEEEVNPSEVEETEVPNLPPDPDEEKEVEEVDPKISAVREDPDFKKFQEDSGSVEIAYKRWKDTSEAGKKLAEQEENLRKELDQSKTYSDSLTKELQTVFQKNPKLAEAMQKELSGQTADLDQTSGLSDEDRKMIDSVRSQQVAESQTVIQDFQENNKDFIQTKEDWNQIKGIATRLDGATDRQGRPYTLQTALKDALILHNPDIIADTAKMETLAAMERRDSATEAGNLPKGSTDTGGLPELSENEKEVARLGGISEESYAKAKKKREARNT